MVEDGDKKEEEKLEFDSTGQAIGYISLDQARVLAMRHARENTGFYGEVYGQQELAWEELSAEESEDYYRVRVSYRPIRGFNGRPGVEIFTIERKETNAFAPVTVVVASQYADVILRRTPTVQNRKFLSALGEPDDGSFTDYA